MKPALENQRVANQVGIGGKQRIDAVGRADSGSVSQCVRQLCCGAKRDFKPEEVELMCDLEEQKAGLASLIHSQPTSLTQMIRGLKQSANAHHPHTLAQPKNEKKKKNNPQQ